MFDVYAGAMMIVRSVAKRQGRTSGKKECLQIAFEYVWLVTNEHNDLCSFCFYV